MTITDFKIGGTVQSKPSVGVITLPGNFNYGNRLQIYAVIRTYQKIGVDAELLNYNPFNSVLAPAKVLAKHMLHREVALPPECLSTPERLEAFNRFNELIPTRRVRRPTSRLLREYDAVSVGSDQVWNMGMLGLDELPQDGPPPLRAYRIVRRALLRRRLLDWYFLRLCEPRRRIALSPSLGAGSVGTYGIELLREGARGFVALSVREREGAELLHERLGRDAAVLCDPTLALGPDEWRAVADDRATPADGYVLAYLLGGAGDDARDVLDKVTGGGAVPVVPLSDRQQPGEPDAGPAEFVSLVDNAAHVVTDSFHAAIFSMLLGTPLTVTRRLGGLDMFSRLESLAETYGIADKLYGSPEFDLMRAGDYSKVAGPLVRERERFVEYIGECLRGAGVRFAAPRETALGRHGYALPEEGQANTEGGI